MGRSGDVESGEEGKRWSNLNNWTGELQVRACVCVHVCACVCVGGEVGG